MKPESSVIDNKKMPNLDAVKFNSLIDLLEEMDNLVRENSSKNSLYIMELIDLIKVLLKKNNHIKILNTLNKLNVEVKYQYLYCYLIWSTLTSNRVVDIQTAIESLDLRRSGKIKFLQNFTNPEYNVLLKHNLITIAPNEFINDSKMSLSKKSFKLLEDEDIKMEFNDKDFRPDGVILPSETNCIKLFFDEKEKQQIDILQSALMPKKFKQLQNRLNEKHLPTAVTAIFFEYPGTGKTESVMQLAKKSGRAIMQVNISETKSKWFGESEKLIKEVFTKYYSFKKQNKKTPILLFNEADAIISKRKDANSSQVAQTENTIQNIILQELEIFDGIFIATTNLVSNIDIAFERRFLFKVEFSKPSIGVMTQIWNSKLKKLNFSNSKLLAEKYSFTGGEINNIVRKIELSEVVTGEKTTIEKINGFCKEEFFDNSTSNSIGFNSYQK